MTDRNFSLSLSYGLIAIVNGTSGSLLAIEIRLSSIDAVRKAIGDTYGPGITMVLVLIRPIMGVAVRKVTSTENPVGGLS